MRDIKLAGKLEVCIVCRRILREVTVSHLRTHDQTSDMSLEDYGDSYGRLYIPIIPLPGVKKVYIPEETMQEVIEKYMVTA